MSMLVTVKVKQPNGAILCRVTDLVDVHELSPAQRAIARGSLRRYGNATVHDYGRVIVLEPA